MIPRRFLNLFTTAAIAVALPFLCACQSPAYKRFSAIKVGMDKSDVVETLGGPTREERWHGKDRWIYEFTHAPGGTMVREIHFDQGRVDYVGERMKPSVSADEQDKINEKEVAEDLQNLKDQDDIRDESVGAQRPKTKRVRSEPEDLHDRKLRQSIYGLDPDPEIERRKVAPHFVPIE